MTNEVTFHDVLVRLCSERGYGRQATTQQINLLRTTGWEGKPVEAITDVKLAERQNEIAVRFAREFLSPYRAYQAGKLLERLIKFHFPDRRKPTLREAVTVPETFGELLALYCKIKGVAERSAYNYSIRLRRTNWWNFRLAKLSEPLLKDKFAEIQSRTERGEIWIYQARKMLACLIDFGISTGSIKLAPRQTQITHRALSPATKEQRAPIPRVKKKPLEEGITFGALITAYLDYHAKDHCISWKQIENSSTFYLKHWEDKIAGNISRADVQQLHTDIGQKHGMTTANRVVQLIRTVYRRALLWEIYDGHNPATGITMFRLQSRDRFLLVEEIGKFLTALAELSNETVRDLLLMCLLTAARRSNVAAMRWEEIDWGNRAWHIPRTKNGTSQLLPLTDWAMHVLASRRAKSFSEWVFPSSFSKTGHITKPEETWKKVKKQSGIQDIRMHDLRRTLASYEAITGANLSVIAATLNHRDIKSTQIYARLHLDPVRDAMHAATNRMFSELSVVTLMPVEVTTVDAQS